MTTTKRAAGLFLSLAAIAGVVIACSGGTTNVDTTDAGPASTTDGSTSATRDSAGSTDAPLTNDGAPPQGGAFSFTAAAEAAPAAGSKVIVVWSVSSGSPDYSYAFGSGSSAGTQVFVSFSSSPPAEALNAGKLGIGLVATVDATANIPEGKLTKGAFEGTITHIAFDHAVIFRSTTEVLLQNGWDKDFPQGFACGQCVRADSGFDSYAPVACSSMKLVPYSKNLDFCNWT